MTRILNPSDTNTRYAKTKIVTQRREALRLKVNYAPQCAAQQHVSHLFFGLC